MNKILLVAASAALSFNAFSFEDFVQDLDANETNISTGFSSTSQTITMSNSSESIKESIDTDSYQFSAAHITNLSQNSLVGFGAGFDRSSSDGEDSDTTSVAVAFIQKETLSNDALSLSFTYEFGEEEDRDEIGFSLSKQLKSGTNSDLDGELTFGVSLPEDTDAVSGGNSFSVGASGRIKFSEQFRLIGGAALVSISDYKYDSGATFSVDPSVGLFVGAAYQLSPSLILDVAYMSGGLDGSISDGGNAADVSSDFSAVMINLDVIL